MDSIRRKYGERAVTRGRLVRAGVPTVFERDPNSAVEGRLGVPEAPTGRGGGRGEARAPRSRTTGSIRRRPRSPAPWVAPADARGRAAGRSKPRTTCHATLSQAGRDRSPTMLDIEHLFGLAVASETNRRSHPECPRLTTIPAE